MASDARPDPTSPDWAAREREHIFARKAEWHQAQARKPLRDKFRDLLALQRQDLPLLRRLRPLEPWERPWEVEP